MSCSNITNVNKCYHQNHLFDNPLCKDQSVSRRIQNVVFHLFTLFIPLIIYRISLWVLGGTPLKTTKPDPACPEKYDPTPRHIFTHKYSTLATETLAFTRNKTAEYLKGTINSKLLPKPFTFNNIKLAGPINQEIHFIASLYEKSYGDLKESIKEHGNNDPWSNPAIIEKADECMKIGYTLATLTLDDLEEFKKVESDFGVETTYAELLTQKFYPVLTVYSCAQIYGAARRLCKWDSFYKGHEKVFKPSISTNNQGDYVKLFFKPGTVQNRWNTLYNELCDRMLKFVSQEELKEKSEFSSVRCTRKDIAGEMFVRFADISFNLLSKDLKGDHLNVSR